ncbi:glycosyltransferase [Flavobacterium sp. 7A]|uniref:glycosyltransferase n=1 Tax=Flavobacterium sp. 7A TaxID=2940571 RepID=UPI0022279D0A|nr:glycosyltransferase [Flavobacterium sp. 7A]MCW2119462.1 glycosyltransferase involved in cell wall biosynthesis [Flavobacterium sp. 7A]
MRIIQLIDSLEAGGAERMAVNYGNALASCIDFSAVASTRAEGPLRAALLPTTHYFFLNKKSALDPKAIWRLRQIVKRHKVEMVHAHSTSIVTAFLLKLVCPSIKLIWHDHYGDSNFLNKRDKGLFRMILPFFNGIISVNHDLKKWTIEQLHFANTVYIPNFPVVDFDTTAAIRLKDDANKRIVCLANLRPQKNHFLLLEVALLVRQSHPDWTFHLIGKDFDDDYSFRIKAKIKALDLEQTIFLYGTQNAVQEILAQANIGILTSASEGLPVALLEYGLARLAVVTTAVGEIPSIITEDKNGFLVLNQEAAEFYEKLVQLMESTQLQNKFGLALNKTIKESYSQESALDVYMPWVQKIVK